MIPHVLTLAAALATAERERDSYRERDAFLMHERIAVATALDVPYATLLGEAVALRLARLTAEREAARSALDGLVAAVRKIEGTMGAQALRARTRRLDAGQAQAAVFAAKAGAYDHAERLLTDALSAAPAPTTVPAPLVRAYLDAVDEWERERSAPVARTVARAAMVAARTALDAALAAATTTPKESP